MYNDPEKYIDTRNQLYINPLLYGEERHDANQKWGPYVRDYYLLHYVISGKGTYTTPKGQFQVCKGQIFVIFPGEETTYAANSQDPWHYYWIGFESSINLHDIFTSYIIDAIECAHIFRVIVNNSSSIDKREWFISGKIYELLAYLSNRQSIDQSKAYQYVLLALEYIEANYQNELKVADLVSYIDISHAYFSRIFRKYTGKTPQRYLVDFRLDKAAELLAMKQLSRSEVAFEVGYFDITNFSRMFCRRFGIPPNAYRMGKV